MAAYPLQHNEPRLIGRDGMLAGGQPAVAQPGQSSTIGRSVSGAIVRRSQLLRVQGEDAVAANVTVVLTISSENNPGGAGTENETPACFASITFGVGGTSADVEVDFLNGALITVPASRLDLTAFLDVPDQDVQTEVRVGAFVSYLPVTRAAQRTLRVNGLANAASVILAVPKFAKHVQLLSSPASTFLLEQAVDAAAGTVVSVSATLATPPYTEIPLLGETRYVRITNTGGAPVNLRALFGLFL